jgi:hypothetical protein
MFEKTGTWSGVLEGTAVFALVASMLVVGMKFMSLPGKVNEPSSALRTSQVV